METAIDPKAVKRTKIAERILMIHQNTMLMEPGWRDINDWKLQNFAYSIADIILEAGRGNPEVIGAKLNEPGLSIVFSEHKTGKIKTEELITAISFYLTKRD